MVLTHSRGQSPEPPGATTPSTSETCLGTKPLRENAALLIWDLMVGRGLCPRAAKGSVSPRGGAVWQGQLTAQPRKLWQRDYWIFSKTLQVQPKSPASDGADEGPATWKTSLWKGPGSPGGHLVEPPSEICVRGKEQQQPSGKLLPESWVERGFPSPVLSTGETILDWWVQLWPSQGKKHKAIQEWTQRRATKTIKGLEPLYHETAGTVQPWKGSGGILPICTNTRWGGIQKTEPESSQLYSVTEQDEIGKTEMQSMSLKHKKILFLPWRQLNARISFPEKLRSPHSRIRSNPAWTQFWPTCPSWPCFEQALNDLPRNLSNLTILWC